MTNNNDWNTVDWDEITEEVKAVVTFENDEPSYYKVVDGRLQVQCYRSDSFDWSGRSDYNHLLRKYGDRFHLRPTPVTKPTPEVPESTQVETSEVEATTTPEFDWSSVRDAAEAVIVEGETTIQQLKSINGILYHRGEMFGKERWIRGHYRTLAATEKYLHLLGCGKCKLIRRPPATTTPEENVTCKVELEHSLFKDELDLLSRNLTPKEFEWYKKTLAQMKGDLLKKAATESKPDADIYDIYKESLRGYKIPPTRTAESTAVATLEQLGYEWEGGELWKPPLGKKPDFTTPSTYTILQEAQQSILKHHGVTGKVKFTVTCSE